LKRISSPSKRRKIKEGITYSLLSLRENIQKENIQKENIQKERLHPEEGEDYEINREKSCLLQ